MPSLPLSRARIALAEDNVDYRTALARLLTVLGHDVVCQVGDGQELLEICRERQVDVVIADLDMPIVDGLEAAEQLSHHRVPVILLSGHPDAEQVKLEHEPISERLLKPVTLETLQAAIERTLSGAPHQADGTLNGRGIGSGQDNAHSSGQDGAPGA